ncbi:BMP family ABC transporter substrate-binding protein [Haloarculaceae archaeon H-GB2-1]|nr:BMP family ABC transporter substrate-binding protein [Haloarculaceae archaeon H-GB11]MEA5408082.1 BMP family ABC transporter substrate-binding protein [Haloarculaceae archaeon H-GB2-1]
MVYALGGLGDKSFNDMAHRGVKQAAEKYDVEFQNAEPSGPSDFKTLQQRFAQSTSPDYDLICCIGFAQTSALKETAKQFPDQNFMLVDSTVDSDNVASYVFKEHEGSFQIGHLAGQITKMGFEAGAGKTNDAGKIGFVGGLEIPLIKKFQAGYMAGNKYAHEDNEVTAAYVGSWTDPAKGKEIALSMYDDGADIVYHGAGASGIGAFKAAQERGRFAVGVDADQSKSASEYKDVILASMVKRVDQAVATAVENVVNGSFKGGQINALGLEKNGVQPVLGQQLGSSVPDDVTAALEESRKAIIDGDITVPTKPGDV